MKNQKSLGNKGFSLVELIVVIAIMAVLMGVLAPTLIGNIEKSRESKDLQNLDSIYNAINSSIATEKGAKDAKDIYVKNAENEVNDVLKASNTDVFATTMRETLGNKVDDPSCASAKSDGYYFKIDPSLKCVVYLKNSDSDHESTSYSGIAYAEKNKKDMFVGTDTLLGEKK